MHDHQPLTTLALFLNSLAHLFLQSKFPIMKYKFLFSVTPFFLLFYSCKPANRNENISSAQDPDSVRIPVTAMAMTRSSGNNVLSFSGSTEARTTVNFGFMVSGKISHVLVDEGSKVSKGQLIADLETTDYTLALDVVNANLQKIQDDYDRLTILQGRGSLPASDYAKATASLNEIKARQKQAIKSLTDAKLYSPISGIVSKKSTNPGEVISPGMPLFSIVDINPIRVAVAVPESEIGQVQPGQSAKVNIPALDSSFSGTVRHVESALSAGKTDSSVKTGLEAELAGQEEQLLEAANQREDYKGDLAVLMGLPYNAIFDLKESSDSLPVIQPVESYLQSAKTNNLDLQLAAQTLQKTGYGVTAAKKDFLPSLNVIGGYSNQSIISVLPENNYFAGLMLSWNFIDFGKRRSVLNERKSQQKQAELGLAYSKNKTDNEVFKAYRKVIQSRELLASSQKALDYRRADYRLKKDRSDAGLILPKDLLETRAALVKAEQDYFSVQLTCRLAITDLEIVSGILK